MTTSLNAVREPRRREELKHFLRTRRERLRPEDVGLPPGARRRTPGLRREEVAMLAGIGASWYTWLEQGRDIKVSEQVLDAISRTLRLDAVERDHLYRLVGMNPPQRAADDLADTAQLTALVEGWMPSPAYVIDRCWDIVGLNRAASLVFGFGERDTNCLVSFFTNPAFRARHRYWAEVAPGLVSEFRRDAARYPEESRFTSISRRLTEESEEFAELWSRYELTATNQGVKGIDHPRSGFLVFDHSVLEIPDRPGIRLMLHTARPGTETREKVVELLGRDERKGRISLVEAG
ncbi:helix-turn-helix transcriptional regulator [Streptomyces sp. NBC_00572]|uniref:helix-turn-helix transcriptional regulator n=1 Tax=Streptomyces sp. NBC_00572 TaxID=2903664 RepID=UPI0022555474|nr:helix-turn-helix transcriptional regulator [Streptomyces sp. NBC_00572]MCX4982045.1 helix-turn-helix transcriptional regulator [Streptomyces sp. NBC_00572]